MRWFRASSLGVRGMLAGLEAVGLNGDRLLDGAGLERTVLDDPDGFVPITGVVRLWHGALREWGSDDLGLRVGAAVPFGTYQVLDYLIVSGPTVGDVLRQFPRYFRLGTDMARYELVPQAGGDTFVRFRHAIADVLLPPFLRDYALTALTTRLHAASGGVGPRHVSISGRGSADRATYEQILGCPVRLRASHNGLYMDRSDWKQPMLAGDAQLAGVLRRHADLLLERQPEHGLRATVRREVIAVLPTGEPTVDVVSRRLGMSGRTLQRRMQEAGGSLSDLVDATRHELALGYLGQPELGASEVGFLLGYSDPSAFTRAFRRWTGMTPTAWRQRRADPDSR